MLVAELDSEALSVVWLLTLEYLRVIYFP